ncbi:hypothetical protein M3Y99_01288200 [Aphelenchoides fujianensis]|nr:hypothetical protein M3Y99_01288200 [Aphelenchoides fujianensis]
MVVGNRVFHVSEIFLVYHSDFLKRNSRASGERRLRTIPIEGIEEPVVKEMLRFMNIGRVKRLKKIARDLALAASRYKVKALLELTVDHLCGKVTLENVF